MAVGIAYTNRSFTPLKVVPKEEIHLTQTQWNQGEGIKRLYHADNIDVLSHLSHDEKVCGRVTLIYIDPPYNTGGAFETRDFKHAYDDCFSIKDYLDFLRKRLELMHTLLSDEGSIYVHLDSNMVFHVKGMMDENLFVRPLSTYKTLGLELRRYQGRLAAITPSIPSR